MCHFITMVVPAGADPRRLKKLLRGHGRDFEIIENWHVRKLLAPDDIYFHTARSCDCGTPLGTLNPDRIDDLERQRDKRIRKQGESPERAERWYRDQMAALSKHDPASDPGGWIALITDLKQELDLAYVGILLHWYAGDLEKEKINLVRSELPQGADLAGLLWRMEEDELLVFQ